MGARGQGSREGGCHLLARSRRVQGEQAGPGFLRVARRAEVSPFADADLELAEPQVGCLRSQIRPSVISLSRLTKWYGNRLAVVDASFDVMAGEVMGLLGP